MKNKLKMKRIIKVIIIIVILIYLIAPLYTIINSPDCFLSGGVWKTFFNTCGDSCSLERNDSILCGMMLMPNCDCGPDKCWNDHECELD